ncbi:MAG TPA: DUF1579 family protein [Planctomycetota bacterium]|nr:DUF1579 family protein [Planctomycetota bacterium]
MQTLTLASLAIAAFSLCAVSLQDKQPERFSHPVPKDADGGMARWIATCKPTAAHARLKELLGKYDSTARLWMAPGSPPMESKGTAEVTWLHEGKWLQQKWTGEIMGQKTSGTAILGYDNFKERYVCMMVDSLQTTMNSASGHFDASGDNLTLWGMMDEPMTPEQDKQVKYVYRGFGKDRFVFELHDMMIGETNTRVYEVEYVRKK